MPDPTSYLVVLRWLTEDGVRLVLNLVFIRFMQSEVRCSVTEGVGRWSAESNSVS